MAATETANQAILSRLQAMQQYHPMTADLFADWTLDPGDVVTVTSGTDSYNVPIFQMNMEWKGASTVQIQSTGSEKRPPLSALKRRSYASGRKQEEQEKQLIRHQADIETSNERILLWATEEEWDEIAQEYALTSKSQFEVTATEIASKVSNSTYQSYVSQTATKLALVVGGTDANPKVNAASILLEINGDGSTSAGIKADKVILSSSGGASVTLADKNVVLASMSYANSNLYVAGDVYAMTPGGSYHAVAGNLVVPDGCNLYFNNGSSGNVVLSATQLAEMKTGILDVQIAGPTNNQYTLQVKQYGDTTWTDKQSFSRATTLRGGFGSGTQADPYKYWNGGVFKVQADPQGNTCLTALSNTGHWGDADDNEDPRVYYYETKATVNGDATLLATGNTFQINAASKLTTTTVTPTSSQQTVAPDPASGYIGFSSVTVEAGTGAVTVSSITAPVISAGAASTSATVTATASNGSTKTANIALVSTSYTPTGESSSHRCVNVSLDGNLIARIDIQAVYTAGYNAGAAASFDISKLELSYCGSDSNFNENPIRKIGLLGVSTWARYNGGSWQVARSYRELTAAKADRVTSGALGYSVHYTVSDGQTATQLINS